MSTLAIAPDSLFARLRAVAADDWSRYVDHAFVRALGDGTLPEASFRHYLVQDYLFLVHFARAYALAAFKADDLAEMRVAGRAMAALLETEMSLHVRYCAGFGLSEADIAASPEAVATVAYTRYVLERGAAGDSLDLAVALSPCIVGYAEIADRLAAQPAAQLAANPYREWIAAYSGSDYRRVAGEAVAQLDRLAARRLGPGRFPALRDTFAQATRLEAGFWDMGLARSL